LRGKFLTRPVSDWELFANFRFEVVKPELLLEYAELGKLPILSAFAWYQPLTAQVLLLNGGRLRQAM
jgi:hypothetical protein